MGAGDMPHCLRALVALEKDWVQLQHLHGGSQLPVSTVPQDLMPSSDIIGSCTYVVHIHTLTHI